MRVPCSARASMPINPKPCRGSLSGSKPQPSSSTSRPTSRSRYTSRTLRADAPECWIAFPPASWPIRIKALRMRSGRARGVPFEDQAEPDGAVAQHALHGAQDLVGEQQLARAARPQSCSASSADRKSRANGNLSRVSNGFMEQIPRRRSMLCASRCGESRHESFEERRRSSAVHPTPRETPWLLVPSTAPRTPRRSSSTP